MIGPAPFTIGADPDHWPGLAKLAEENGELGQVIGKLLAYPVGEHPDGAGPLPERLADELGDMLAAIDYVRAHTRQLVPYRARIEQRHADKLRRFQLWHGGATGPAPEREPERVVLGVTHIMVGGEWISRREARERE